MTVRERDIVRLAAEAFGVPERDVDRADVLATVGHEGRALKRYLKLYAMRFGVNVSSYKWWFHHRDAAAACTAVLIWASFLIVTRFAVQGTFTVAELLFLRLMPAAVLLAPVMWSQGVLPRGLSWWRVLTIMVGAGIGFPAILVAGLQFAPASDAGALAPGTLP